MNAVSALDGGDGGNAIVGVTERVLEASCASTVTADSGACTGRNRERQGGNGRSDAVRLLARIKPSKGVNALRGARRPPKSISGSAT